MSLLGPKSGGDIQLFIREKEVAADAQYRELTFENVSFRGNFVIPHYKDEQKTRQVLRYLIANVYKVFNNSPVVDLIWGWLCIKAHLLSLKYGRYEAFLIKNTYARAFSVFLKNVNYRV